MSPASHLFASWLIAAKTTRHPRDCRLVALGGLLPDLDGLGLLVDLGAQAVGDDRSSLYASYHHFLLHGLPAGLVITLLFTVLARDRLRVAVLCLALFHLHLLFDFLGSRGPSAEDLWPVFYLGPLSREPMWLWRGQWRLDGWQNQLITWTLFVPCLVLAVKRGDSFVGVFSRWADRIFVRTLRQGYARVPHRWMTSWRRRR